MMTAPYSSVPPDLRPKPPAKPKHKNVPLAPPDPFAPFTPQQINQTINRFTGMYGTPQTNEQIQASAQSQIDPIIAAITKNENARAAASSQAIRSLTDSYAHDLAGVNYAAPYQQAEGDQAAVDAALQQSLTGAGSDLASQLKSRLAPLGAGDPAVNEVATGLADRGAAIGTTELAHGSSALSSLIANAAAAGSYGQKLPGIAKLSGIQGVKAAESQATNNIATGTQNALGQLPSIVQALLAANQNLQGNRASSAADLYTTLTGQNLTKATAKAGLVNDQTNAAITGAYDNAKLGIAQQNANTAQTRATNAAKKAKAPKPLSASALKNLNSQAHDLYNGVAAHQHYNTKTQKWEPVPGTGQPPVRWGAAVAQLVANGASKEQAVKILSAQGWKPGEGGRPLTGKQKKAQKKTATAVKSGLGLPPDPYKKYGG